MVPEGVVAAATLFAKVEMTEPTHRGQRPSRRRVLVAEMAVTLFVAKVLTRLAPALALRCRFAGSRPINEEIVSTFFDQSLRLPFRSDCLTRSVALALLLGRRGMPAEVVI